VAVYAFAETKSAATAGDFVKLRDAYLAKWRPLWLESQQAWWEASTTGSDSAFERKKSADKALVELHSDKEMFAKLKSLKEGKSLNDPVQQRELDVMYRTHLRSQGDPELLKKIIDLENEVEQAFNTHRSLVGDRELTENDVRQVLGESTDSGAVATAWKAYMEVGKKVAGHLRQLVAMRNTLAKQLGFPNYHALSLNLQEIDGVEFLRLFDELDELTRAPFAEIKRGIDASLATKFKMTPDQLRPWHFGDLFFQEAPRVSEVNLDEVFKDADILELSRKYYASLGLPCDDVVKRSDLYEKPGKSPHAFCTHIDREGDIRVLCNIKPNLYWADTVMHELGHAVYDKYISRDVPFLLREPSHSITTEGIAMMFGAFVKNEDWLVNVRGLPKDEAVKTVKAARATLRAEKILFSRWTQVMVRFEHGMYTNPDQDFNKLWWDLKKKYQLLNPPDSLDGADYAAKVHILTNPVYYHSYLMGDLFPGSALRRQERVAH
jgi:peptidyl-dipeptidase A